MLSSDHSSIDLMTFSPLLLLPGHVRSSVRAVPSRFVHSLDNSISVLLEQDTDHRQRSERMIEIDMSIFDK